MSWFKRGNKKGSPGISPEPASAPAIEHPPETLSTHDEETPARAIPRDLADLFLVMEEHLNELELEDVRSIVATLRQPPPLVERLTNGLDDPEELREAIISSPSLSADVLRVVNSAAFALVSPISSIEHAVSYLGTTMVKGLVLQSAVTQVMSFDTDVQKSAYMRIWRSSYVASTTAHTYATLLAYEHPSIYSTRALLVSVGDLALISARPELAVIYAPKTCLIGRVEAQQNEMMANSAVLSSMLAQQWGLPKDICDSLRHSLTPLAWPPTDSARSIDQQREDALLYLASRIGDAVSYGGLKNIEDFTFPEESTDFFYLHEYLDRCELGSLIPLLQERKNNRRVQQVINNVAG